MMDGIGNQNLAWVLVYGFKCHFQQYFRHFVVPVLLVEETGYTEKTTNLCRKSDKLYRIMLYQVPNFSGDRH